MYRHTYPRPERQFSTDVGPRGGQRLHIDGRNKPVTDTARNRNTLLPAPVVDRRETRGHFGCGIVYDGPVKRNYTTLKIQTCIQHWVPAGTQTIVKRGRRRAG